MAHRVKISTDASFDPETGKATYAYWIETEQQAFKAAKVFPMTVDNSSVAELLAFVEAFRRTQKELGRHVKLSMHLTTDSLWVVEGLRGRFINFSGIERPHRMLMQYVMRLIDGHELHTRHIPSHTKKPSTAFHLNNWCDQKASELLKKELGKNK